jgi:NAD(P)H-hydrate epimerase
MSQTASFVYTPDQVREIDRIAIAELGIRGGELMTRAGRAVFELGRERFANARRWLILCGAGNNAGDGYVIAGLAKAAGCEVTVAALSDPHQLTGDAASAWQDFQRCGGGVVQFSETLCRDADLVIDAMLGTGLTRSLEGAYLHAVESVNASPAPIIAVDIPTGLSGESGRVLGAAVTAQITVTFIGRKQGLYLGAGPEHCGEVIFADLGVPLRKVAHVPPSARLFDRMDHSRLLPRRRRTSHKGDFGHVLVIGGNDGMGGSVRLAGEAALRAGCGLVSVATRPENVAAVTSGRPELMCRGIATTEGLKALLSRATVIAIGPGLGQDSWARDLLDAALETPRTLVVDADALNLVAQRPRRRDSWVLTPHPGEASRLLERSTAQVQSDRMQAVADLCARYGGVALLKGRCTLVGQAGELPYVIDAGNPGMATAGMGDVLTGLIAGLLAQSEGQPLRAAACAAYVHARVADDAALMGERGLIAGDLFPRLRAWLNPVR